MLIVKFAFQTLAVHIGEPVILGAGPLLDLYVNYVQADVARQIVLNWR